MRILTFCILRKVEIDLTWVEHESELGFCQTCGLNRIKVVKTTTHGKKSDLPYLMMQTLYHTRDSLTSA